MKKIFNPLLILIILMTTVITCGCNQYFVSESVNDKNSVFYGAFNRRDFIHADATIFKKDSDKVCEGVIYLNAPSRAITMKNDKVDAKMLLGCSDGDLIELDWRLRKGSFKDGSGVGEDRFGNEFKFKTIEKKDFQKIAGKQKINFVRDKKESYLKY